MLETCRLSREVALLFFQPRIQLCILKDKPTRILCAMPNNDLESADRIHIYTKTRHNNVTFQVGSELCAVINWMHTSLGFRIIELSKANITAKYLASWPLEEGDRLDDAFLFKGKLPVDESVQRRLPRRLQGMSIFAPRRSRDRRKS